jgi:hypothetical protein
VHFLKTRTDQTRVKTTLHGGDTGGRQRRAHDPHVSRLNAPKAAFPIAFLAQFLQEMLVSEQAILHSALA